MEFPFRRSTSRDNYNEEGSPQPLRALRNSISEGSSSLFDSMKGAKNGLFGGISSKFDQVLKRGDSGSGFSAQEDTRNIPSQKGGGVSPKVSAINQDMPKASPPKTPPTSVSSGGSPQPKGGSPQPIPQAEPSPGKPKPKPPRPTRGPSLDRSTYVKPNGMVRRGSADSDRSYDGQDTKEPSNVAISFDEPLYGKQTAETTPKNVQTKQDSFFSDDVFASVTKGIENLNANIPDDEAILNKNKRPNVTSNCDPPSAKFTNVPQGAETTTFERPSGAVTRSNPFMNDMANDSYTSHPSDPQQMALSSSGSAFEPVMQTTPESSTTVQADVHNARSPDKSRLSIDLSSEGDDPNIASLLGADLLPGIPRIPGNSSSNQSSLNPGTGRDLLAITPTMSEVLPKPDIQPAIVPKDEDSDAESSATEGCDELMDPSDVHSPDRHNDYLFRTGSVGSDKSWSSSYSNESQMDEQSVNCMHFMKSFVMKIFDLGSISQADKAIFGEICQCGPGRLWFARYVNAQVTPFERVNNKRVNEHIFYQLVQYFAIVLFECNETEDYSPAKTLMNMCFTFYHEVLLPRGPPMKHYLYSYMKDQPIWQSIRFWNAAFFDAVQCERARKPMATNYDANETVVDDKQFQENITFGQLGTFTCNMRAFGLSKELCQEFLRKQSIIANLREEQVQMLKENVERWKD